MKWGKLLWWIFFMSVILACWTDGTVSEDLRWRAVLLYEDDGYSYAKIALLLRLSESSCRRYVRMWYRFHTVRPVRYRRERNPIPPEHMEHLIGLLREDAALYLYEMRSKLEQQFQCDSRVRCGPVLRRVRHQECITNMLCVLSLLMHTKLS
jgi:transposase